MSAMKVGTEDRKKLIVAGGFGLAAVVYLAYTFLGGGSSEPPSASPATVVTTSPAISKNASAQATARITPSKLDPTLHPEGMLLTDSLVYSGKGRNIFAAPGTQAALAKVAAIPKPIASGRYVPPAAVKMGPRPPPPINLRYFGNAVLHDGSRQAFLLQGDDVFVAKKGDIVSRRYKIGDVTANDIEVTDLTNNNTQRIPITKQ